ncbi:MAG: hypothetical protein V3T72_09470 [Thermoanaerobaculia bacterium]
MTSILLLALAAAAAGQNEFFLYQSPCQVTVMGNLDVTASVTGAASATGTDSASFVTNHAIPSTTNLTFSDSGDADANLSITYADGCTTQGSSDVSGETGYDFVGDLDDMVFNASSSRSHADSITRIPFGVASGTNATADSDYTVPQLDAIEVFVPFQVAGGDNGKITVTDFDLKRTDTGPTTGNMVAVWQVFTDVNGNCKLDFPQDQSVGGAANIVFPNSSSSGPASTFATPRGNYILWLTYFNNSAESVASASCLQSASASSDVRDTAKIRLQLN